MDTRYLQYFVAIAEERNMTRAAERLHVSQSSLSYQLSKLESEVGTLLFLRNKNDMTLTTAGRLYLDTALSVIAAKDRLYQNIAELNQHGRLRVSISPAWSHVVMANIVLEFNKTFPDHIFEISYCFDLNPLKDEVKKCNLDFALFSLPFYEPFHERTELLGKEELLLAVPSAHPYVRDNPGHSITQEEFARRFFDETFLVSKRSIASRQLLEQLFMRHRNAAPSKMHEVDGMVLTYCILAQDVGVAFIPSSAKIESDKIHKIHYYSCQPKVFCYNVMMYRENLVFNEPVQHFFDCVKKHYQNHVGPVTTASLELPALKNTPAGSL